MEFSRHIPSLEHSELNSPAKYLMDESKIHSPDINISHCLEIETEPQVTAVNQLGKFSKPQDFASVKSMVYDVAKQPENAVKHDGASSYNYEFISNPIAESLEYRAYRARQEDKDFYTDKKWPSMLDNFFLDAMIDIPIMGKKKFTYNGKLHGHNQMISLYIWIAYTEFLPSNVAPDLKMIRSRKQISSHIQVLKKLLQGNAAFQHIFSEDVPEGISFDDNPCLIALSKQRLPSKAYRQQVRKEFYRKLYQLEGQDLTTSIPDISVRPEVSLPITTGKDHFQQQQQETFSSGYLTKSNVGLLTASESSFHTATYTPKISSDLGLMEQNPLYQSFFNLPFYEISPPKQQNSNFAYSTHSIIPYQPTHNSSMLHNDIYNDTQNKYYLFIASHKTQAQPQALESERVEQRTESLESKNINGSDYCSYPNIEDMCSYRFYGNSNNANN
ncbi:putative transcription factor [Erysiphe neolycopersici]|uniref:Putative transcription factor n=1 Tax=Erysiphe neolycopersici TaxID=212602 RepID=A0A420HK65_9PEZI|nr:putative transcription factor [Erysiphe neolycopersici]